MHIIRNPHIFRRWKCCGGRGDIISVSTVLIYYFWCIQNKKLPGALFSSHNDEVYDNISLLLYTILYAYE